MAELVNGLWLNQYVAPQLLQEFLNYKDDFVGLIPNAPAGAVSADGLRFNKLINNVNFLINNDQDFDVQSMPGQKGLIEWDKLDTDPTAVDDAEIRSLQFDKRAQVRMKHAEAWKIGYRNYIMQKLAPAADANGMPVLRTTGDVEDGRRKLLYADLIKFWSIIEGLNLPNRDAYNMILCREHIKDLIDDRANTQNYRDIGIDPATGKLTRFYSLKLHENNYNPKYAADGSLKALGAAAVATDKNASTFFYAPNAVTHIDKIKILYKPEHEDTRSADPTSEFRLQGYGLTDKVQDYGFGSMVSGNE